MSRSMRYAARAAVLFVVLAAAQVGTATLPSDDSPYLSALSNLAAPAALATPACNEKTCAKEPGRGPRCVKSGPGVTCYVNGGCFASAC